MSIALNTRLSRNDEILHAVVNADELVMMSISASSYYGLSGVGVRIWELLEQPMTVAELCAHLCEEFEVDAQICEVEVLKFAAELANNGVVRAA